MRPSHLLLAISFAGSLAAQQFPFIPVTGPNSPAAAHLFQDSRGAFGLPEVKDLPISVTLMEHASPIL
jgi:hypothetical protein